MLSAPTPPPIQLLKATLGDMFGQIRAQNLVFA
jgi:hypothetical protein